MSRIFCIGLIMLLVQQMYAQDVIFSQFYNNQLFTNPSQCGNFDGEQRLIFDYNNQGFNAQANPFRTYALSFDSKEKKFSWGLTFLRDKIGNGIVTLTNCNLLVAKTITLTKNDYFSCALEAGWAQYSFDIQNLTWNNQFDGFDFNNNIESGESFQKQYSSDDIALGILWKHVQRNKQAIHLGISTYHISHPLHTLNDIPSPSIKWSSSGDITFRFSNNPNLALMPAFLYINQNQTSNLNVGFIAKYKVGTYSRFQKMQNSSFMNGGLFYQTNSIIGIYAGISFQNQMDVAITYNVPFHSNPKISKALQSVELSVSYLIAD